MAAPPSRRASPPALPEELVEEILLRLPPDDPGCLLRASLVCKTWGLAVSHSGFRRRFHDHHRLPPVLGFLHGWNNERISHFIPTTASSFSLAAPDWRSWRAIDCRHGRALFLSNDPGGAWELLLWEPTTGAQWRVPVPTAFESEFPTAAVFCAADGCDHLDCLGGPFRLVFLFTSIFDYFTPSEDRVTSACVYSSETGTWGEPTSLRGEIGNFTLYASVLVRNSLLYFLSDGEAIQEYDLARHSLTVFDAPDNSFQEKFNLMLAENGELGVSESLDGRLNLWSRELSGGTAARWVLTRVICFEISLPNGALVNSVDVLGFAEGANAIFVSTFAGLFMIDLQSDRFRMVCENHGFCNLIPVVGFYTPLPRDGRHYLPPSSPTDEAADEDGGDLKKTFDQAQQLFEKGPNAIKEGDFDNVFGKMCSEWYNMVMWFPSSVYLSCVWQRARLSVLAFEGLNELN
ncbi:hypothetical protein QYE76_060532 [Lolium multiflorum]|uniref:F-box domain-containing protein n=1 Tax=Lolium multiflorum TaxID=4521 RepID=A0AAD8RZF0_LOLMU|nr:hypothetical protein QYE76_060532 [Lolium multiflorum]